MKKHLHFFLIMLTLVFSIRTGAAEKFESSSTGPVLHGAVLGTDKYGIYSVGVEPGSELEPARIDNKFTIWGGVLVDGKYHVYSYKLSGGRTFWYAVYNPETWEVLREESQVENITDQIYCMTYDVTTGNTYAISQTSKDVWKTLSVYYLDKATTKSVGALDVKFLAIAANPQDGQLYGIAEDANLYKINKENATIALVGSTGLSPRSLTNGAIFDKDTGVLYWTTVLSDNTSGLYKVDITTGKAELLTEFTKGEQMTGLYLIYPPLNPVVPSNATNLSYLADAPGSFTGKISFKVPEKTIDGNTISGNADVKIQVGIQTEIKETLAPGTVYEKDVTIEKGGSNTLRVTVSNSSGEGEMAVYKFWVGKDYPTAVSGLTATAKNDGVEVDWDAPAEGLNNGYLDVANLKYIIKRYPDNVVLSDNYTSTNFIDKTISGLMKVYSYAITPYIDSFAGDSLLSGGVIYGDPFTIPYKEEFITSDAFKLWTLTDGNNDGQTWSYDSDNQCAISAGSYSGDVDDWMISPAIQLESGTAYTLSYKFKAINSWRQENMKVGYASSADPSDMVILADYNSYKNTTYTEDKKRIVIPNGSAGEYHIGFYSYSESSNAYVAVDDVNIEVLAVPGTPDVVNNLVINPGTAGAKNANLSFGVPTADIGGSSLSEPVNVSVFREGEENPVKTYTAASVGQKIEWTDTDALEGMNYYRIICSNSKGNGLEISDSVYVGIDIPVAVENLALENVTGEGVISWDAPIKGIHGGYVDPSQLKYTIVRSDGLLTVEGVEGTSYTDNTPDKENQSLVSYTITPINTQGEGVSAVTEVVRFGKAYPAPYNESFADGQYTKTGWNSESLDEYNGIWVPSSTSVRPIADPQDNDNGFGLFKSSDFGSGIKARFETPVIDVSTVNSPILKFWFYHHVPSYAYNEELTLFASKDNEAFEDLGVVILANENNNGWTLYEIPLSQYKGVQDLRIGFTGIAKGWGYDVMIDNISIENQEEKDMKVRSFGVPSTVIAGKNNLFTIEVKNSGTLAASAYSVELYKGDEKIVDKNYSALASNAVETIECPVNIPLEDAGKTYEFRCEVKFEGDLKPENNVSDLVSVTVQASMLESVSEPEAEEINNEVKLTWKAPSNPKTSLPVLEDFESYTNFIIEDIGEWTLYDEDKKATYVDGNYFLVPYANKNAPMAYQVFNSRIAGVANLGDWESYSGAKSLASFTTADNTVNNDWLVSPLLPGAAQTISFYAKGVPTTGANRDRFIVYYSTGDNAIESFVQLSQGNFIEAETEWTIYEFDLPAGAKYFAVRCVSDNNLTFLLDDISFIKADQDIEVIGYNIYRNDEKINSQPVTAAEFIDQNPVNGINTYKVTAVYEDGESAYSEQVSINFESSGIEQIEKDVQVYAAGDHIVVKGAFGLPVKVFTVRGLTVYSKQGTGEDIIPVDKGIYIVKSGKEVTKVIVK